MLFLLCQESSLYNEGIVLLLPAAVYAICAGHAPFLYELKDFSSSSLLDAAETFDNRFKVSDHLDTVISTWSFLMDIMTSISF